MMGKEYDYRFLFIVALLISSIVNEEDLLVAFILGATFCLMWYWDRRETP